MGVYLTRDKHSIFNMSKPNTILSINAGSSSLKITLFSVKEDASSSYLEKIAGSEVSERVGSREVHGSPSLKS